MKSEYIKYVLKGFRLKFLILLLIVPASTIFSQSTGLTENDIILNAQALFDKKDYQAAIPLYAQLVSVHPDDPLFNYRFGVCTLFGDRKDKKKPIRYLTNAAKTIKDDPELLYFLGMAYHQNMEFANAMKYFNSYISNLPSSSPERGLILENVNACLNGLNLADKNLVAEIVSTSKFQKDNFHRAYAAQDFNGSLVIKPEMFVSEKERKTGDNSYVYLIHPSSVLYFSGFTIGENSNRDIFKVELDENGDWGIPEKADDILNTSFDENYPVLVDNGSTLYFCSKGHNSLGGYDIYKSTLNPETNKFDQPENLGAGVNSPFDDIVFIPTKDKSYAYFASDRDNLNGSINVYKIRLSENANLGEKILAENKNVNDISTDGQSIKTNNNSVNGTSNGNSEIASEQNNLSKPYSDASKKAATMVNDRTKSQALADSSFMIVTSTKELIRDLTNKRDRANAISQRKADESKTLELRFNESIALLAEATSEEQFLQDLDKSIKFKEDLYQLQQRSNHANKIAWNLGSQVKIKNQELETLKVLAGKIQTASVSGTFEETLLLFSKYKNVVTAIDTLVDYSEQLTAITNNKTTFNIPASELAFAENLKKAYKNNTLLAEMKTSKPVINENIPIVIVDKTANGQISNTVNQTTKESFMPAQLVLPVIYSPNLALKDPGNEILNFDFKIDNITQALPLVNAVQYASVSLKSAGFENIDLEINFNVDALASSDIYPLVQPVLIKQNSTLLAVSDQDIVLNFDIDVVRPEKLVLPVEYAASDKLKLINEEIEISKFNDKSAIMNSIAVVEPIYVVHLVSKSFPEESLELNFTNDEAKALKLAEIVENNYIAQNANSIQEEIEIGLFEDKTIQSQPEVIVQPVYSNYLAVNKIQEEAGLEIGFEIDQVEPGIVVEQIQINLLALNKIPNDEQLEINNSNDGKAEMLIASVIEPIYSTPGMHLFSEENIEIDFQSDAISASNLIVPVLYREKDVIDFASLEPEIEIVSETIEAKSLVEPVYFSSTGFSKTEYAIECLELIFDIDESKPVVSDNIHVIAYKEQVNPNFDIESELVLDFKVDQVSESYAIATPVSFLNTPGGQDFMNDEPIEISFKIDPETNKGINALNSGNLNPQEIAVKNAAVNSIEMKNNQDQIVVADEIYFLRDALMPTGGIESSKSDYEILYKALNNPDELSYEELLFAANMTDDQEEKLAIYNVAFVHIDRDWRAFNNAAVSAIHKEDLSKANCFLYQATLLSSENGHIQNNMGILACHQSQFKKAEDYFVAASNLGYDAQYNLKLANGLAQIAAAGKTSDQQKIKNSEKNEDVIVDIIDYKTSEK